MAGMCRMILLSCLLADGVCFREAKGGQQDPETERAEWSVQCLQPAAVLRLVLLHCLQLVVWLVTVP